MDTFFVSGQTAQPQKTPARAQQGQPDIQGQSILQFLRIQDVARLTTLSKSYIYKLQAEGQFPKSFQMAPKVSVWTADSIREWMQAQVDKAA
jgi:predicted DNA-binding transcriptional regulator AlpA